MSNNYMRLTARYFNCLIESPTKIGGTVTLTADALMRNARPIGYGEYQINLDGPNFPITGEYPFFIYPNSDPDQSWFWTEEWQAEEREAREDFAAGRYQEFSSMDDFIGSLDDLLPKK